MRAVSLLHNVPSVHSTMAPINNGCFTAIASLYNYQSFLEGLCVIFIDAIGITDQKPTKSIWQPRKVVI